MAKRSYSMRIEGLPPKKDGANSMWAKPTEVNRLIRLRQSVLAAFQGDPPMERNISLKLKVHVGPKNTRYTGDLDNFLTGICDGLMAADPRCKPFELWQDPQNATVQPTLCIGIKDDHQVIKIEAEKIVGDSDQPWYLLELHGE